ncbi:engulfment and cell motility protein 1-like [Plakobranchus ocellatus]|uniref:Engulfment and cell motility protein 1-like n=1 Tax=Plakobranchus ocellatus TaxID=259542 RepID=A0AAV4BBH7_9GAST|nr:engulfment and cell motility protein 1-like [Plakobranchus ocellatus]
MALKSLKGDRSSTVSTTALARTLPITPKKNQDDNIKKVAVTMPDLNTSEQQGQLIEFDQTMSLEAIIKDICQKWSLTEPKNYALRFNETNQKMYITESNRNNIRDGQVLNLTPSAGQTARQIQQALSGSRLEDKNTALRQLSFLASDFTFAMEFIRIEAHRLIIDIVQGGNFKGDPLAYTLKSFVCLMDHAIISWEILDVDFIKKVADCVSVSSSNLDPSCLQSALAILESVVLHW